MHRLIKVHSHPRSGTHFVEAFLGKNFYKGKDLSTRNVIWGHWANRLCSKEGNPYGKLFGHHLFPSQRERTSTQNMIYVYRDPRAVAYSVWKTPNFIHPNYNGISFSDFLRMEMDWLGSPSKKANSKYTIAEHWYNHVDAWHKIKSKNLLIIKYEQLVDAPQLVFQEILGKFFPFKHYLSRLTNKSHSIDPISKPLGLLPNKAKKDSWKEAFTREDLSFFLSKIPNKKYFDS